MAAPTTLDLTGDRSVMLITWNLTQLDHTGDPVAWYDWADRSITFIGATWSTAVAALEGSNDNTNWVAICDVQGAPITKTGSNGIETAVELTRFVRPRLSTVGTGSVVAAQLIMRKGY
jgi:hypothetical protein